MGRNIVAVKMLHTKIDPKIDMHVLYQESVYCTSRATHGQLRVRRHSVSLDTLTTRNKLEVTTEAEGS